MISNEANASLYFLCHFCLPLSETSEDVFPAPPVSTKHTEVSPSKTGLFDAKSFCKVSHIKATQAFGFAQETPTSVLLLDHVCLTKSSVGRSVV